MADDGGTARVGLQAGFEGPQGVDVKVVCGLVQEQQVGPALEHLCEVHAVALTTREVAHLLLLVRSLEVERCHVGPAVHLAPADLHELPVVGDLLVDGPFGVKGIAGLVHVADLDG